MTIFTSLDYHPTAREKQEYAVMAFLEEAIRCSRPIDTHDLAVRIVDALENSEPAEVEDYVVG